MKPLYRIILLMTAIITSFYVSADSQGQLKFHSLSVNDGLSQHDITDIVEDSFGFIWIATYDGLNRYDGKRIRIFRHSTGDENSLSGNRIMCIMEDSRRHLWIGTDGYGINYYSLAEERIVRVKTPSDCKVIYSFAEDKNGNIYAGTNNGLVRIDENRGTAELLQLPIAGLMVSNIATLKNDLYISTEQGVWTFDGKNCELLSSIPQDNYVFVESDGKENIWFATRVNVIKQTLPTASGESKTFDIRVNNIIRSLHYDHSGQLLVGTETGGILTYDARNMLLLDSVVARADDPRGLKSNCVTALLVDAQHIMWVGTNSGFYFTNLDGLPFHTLPQNGGTGQIGFVYAGKNYVYVSRGIKESTCYLSTLEGYRPVPACLPLDMKKVVSIGGRNYIATGSGIYIQTSADSHNYIPYTLSIRNEKGRSNLYTSLVVDDFGNKYIGSWRGLIIEKTDGRTDWVDYWNTKAEVLRNEGIYDLYYDARSKSVWVGTVASGLFRINLDASGDILGLQNFSVTANGDFYIPCNQIWTIFCSANGTLWLGTDAGLLRKNSENESFEHIQNVEILDKKIMSIQEDTVGNLWMGNTQGLIKYSPATNLAQRFTYDDGLQSNTFTEASSKSEEGILFFGGLNGINWFNPTEIIPNNPPARILFTGFMVNNEYVTPLVEGHNKVLLDTTINMKTSLTLAYFQNDFTLEYTTVPFNSIQKYRTRYMLQGMDKDWVNASHTDMIVWYKNLPPGNYTFIVEGYDANAAGKVVSRAIDICIKPAPWDTWWAYFLYSVAFFSIVFIVWRVYDRHRKLKYQLEQDKSLMEQEEKMNEMKLMFFTDIAHEFKTPLSLIVGPVNDLVEKGPADEEQSFRFKVISRNVRRMMFLVNQLLDFRKITKGCYSLRVAEMDLAAFVRQVAKAFAWEADNERVNFNVNTPEELICWFDPNIIEKVLYNILSNAFRYTKTGGVVVLTVRSVWKNSQLVAEIAVADNGPGIADDMKPHVFERFYHGTSRYSSGIGLHLSDTLMKEHHGEINIADSVYNGVEFIISFPGLADAYSEKEFQPYQEEKRMWLSEEMISKGEMTDTSATDLRDKLLIVEDDMDLRLYLRKCLESRYIISEARNGVEGFRKALKVIPDLIVSDVMMPEMDGLEMLRKIREEESLSHIPIILLTAKTDIDNQTEGFEAGAFDYICKPFNTKILLKKIENFIEQQAAYRNHLLTGNVVMEIETNFTSYDRKLMDRLNILIEDNLDNSEMTIDFLSKELGISRMHLHRKIKGITGETSTSYVNLIRMKHARKLFDDGCDRVQEVMDAVGISSSSYFNKLFKSYYNETPSSYLARRKK